MSWAADVLDRLGVTGRDHGTSFPDGASFRIEIPSVEVPKVLEAVLPAVSGRRGWPVLHRMHVLQAPEGCDYDFLRAQTPEQLSFVEPVIGRS